MNKLTRIISDNPQVSRKELLHELETVGINVSKGTVSNALKECGVQSNRARKTPFLAKRHVKERLEFANNFLLKPASFWDNVIWSDETKIELFNHSY